MDSSFQPKLIGNREASTFTGFCGKHDSETFRAIEVNPFSGTQEQLALLAYRSVSMEIFAKIGALRHVDLIRSMDRGQSPQRQRFIQSMASGHEHGTEMGVRDLQHHKGRLEDAMKRRDFSEVNGFVVELSETPELVVSGAMASECDFLGNVLQRMDKPGTLDYMSFNLLPTDDGGAAVFAWLGNQVASEKLVDSLVRLGDEDLPRALVRYAFEFFENICTKPSWWNELAGDKQKEITQRYVDGVLFHREGCLLDDGFSIVDWTVKGRLLAGPFAHHPGSRSASNSEVNALSRPEPG
jgi:hypothetical protein